jgi:hypothetical protein
LIDFSGIIGLEQIYRALLSVAERLATNGQTDSRSLQFFNNLFFYNLVE